MKSPEKTRFKDLLEDTPTKIVWNKAILEAIDFVVESDISKSKCDADKKNDIVRDLNKLIF